MMNLYGTSNSRKYWLLHAVWEECVSCSQVHLFNLAVSENFPLQAEGSNKSLQVTTNEVDVH